MPEWCALCSATTQVHGDLVSFSAIRLIDEISQCSVWVKLILLIMAPKHNRSDTGHLKRSKVVFTKYWDEESQGKEMKSITCQGCKAL